MKKLALILASLTFFAGCARNDTPDMTETETETEYGIGTPAPGETGTDMDTDVNITPVDPADTNQITTPRSSRQALESDQDVQIITTNELNAPGQTGGQQPGQQSQSQSQSGQFDQQPQPGQQDQQPGQPDNQP